jgi:hypothetical protein
VASVQRWEATTPGQGRVKVTLTRCSAPFPSYFLSCSRQSGEAHHLAAASSSELVRVNHRASAHPTPPKAPHCSALHRRRPALVGRSCFKGHFSVSSSLEFELRVARLTWPPSAHATSPSGCAETLGSLSTTTPPTFCSLADVSLPSSAAGLRLPWPAFHRPSPSVIRPSTCTGGYSDALGALLLR